MVRQWDTHRRVRQYLKLLLTCKHQKLLWKDVTDAFKFSSITGVITELVSELVFSLIEFGQLTQQVSIKRKSDNL